jgi:hypothetical protein
VGRWAELTLGDIARSLLRYRPAVVAVAVLVLALQLLPDRGGRVVPTGAQAGGESAVGGPRIGGGSGGAATTTSTPVGADVGAGAGTGDDGAPFSSSSSFAGGDGFGDSSSSSSSSTSGEIVGGSSGDSSSSGDDGFSSSFGTEETRPLRVVEYGWATATAGTPLAASDVPDGTMPVGKRIGRDDKLSFVRLDGTTTDLVLSEASSGQRTPPAGAIGVQACQSTEADWTPGGGKTFDEAPAYDSTQCVAGVRSADGQWRFDLTRFIPRTDRRGFVLVSTPDAAIDFQVAFKPN